MLASLLAAWHDERRFFSAPGPEKTTHTRKALEFKNGVATIIAANGRRIPGEERACKAGKPLPHKPAVSQAERKSWRGARMIFGGEDGRGAPSVSSSTGEAEEGGEGRLGGAVAAAG